MSDVIDLSAEREKRDAPDAEFVRRDDFGRPLYLFGLEYEFGGKQWACDLWAYSWEDAEGRVAGMRQSLAVSGQIHARIPE